MTRTFLLAAAAVLSTMVACSSDDEPVAEKKDVGIACSEMCRDSGFTSSKKEEAPTEVNCYCSVGPASAKVEDATCTKMCTAVGIGAGKPFGATGSGNANSCQCQ
jgi:hypothetical protein